MRSRSPLDRGFTLVEIVTVIVLAGMLLSIAIPRIVSTRSRYNLDSAAYQVAGDLRRAQIEAIRRNTPVTLERINDSTYNIDFIGDRSLQNMVRFNPGASADSVRLAAFGPPTTGARTFTVQLNGVQRTVTVSAAGLVSVQ